MDQTPEIVEEDIGGSIKAKSGKEISILKFNTEEEIIGTSCSSEMAGKSTHQSSDLASEAGSWRKLHHIWWKENGRFVRLRANFHFEVWKWSKNYRNISSTKKRRLIPPPRSRFPFRLLRWKKKSAEHQLKRMPGRFFHTCLHVHLHVWGWRWNYQNTS